MLSLFVLHQIVPGAQGILSSAWRVPPGGYRGRLNFTTDRHLVLRLRMHECYIHSHILLRDVVRNWKYVIYFVILLFVVYIVTSH
jgi:hypothetical protein